MSKLRRLSRGFLSKFAAKPAKRERARRRLITEQLEDRRLLAGDFARFAEDHNPGAPADVNASGEVTPLDALIIINKLNAGDEESEGDGVIKKTDVNNDGHTTPIDVLQVVNFMAESEGTTTFNITAVPFDQVLERPINVNGTTVSTLDQSTWGNIQANDEIILSNAIDNQGNVANGQYTVTNVSGTSLTLNQAPNLVNFFGTVQVGRIITQIGTNTDFVLGIVAEDLTSDGPFAVFTDIDFDSTLASVTGLDITGDPDPDDPTDNFKFNSFVNGKSGDFTTTPGLVDEAGAFRPAGGGLGSGVHLAFTVDMRTSGATGTLDLALSAAGIIEGEDPNGPDFPSGLPAHDVLVNGSNVPVCQMIRTQFLPNDTPPCDGMVMYNGTSLLVTSDIIAQDDTATVNEDEGPVFINVLANDSVNVGTGPTITTPIPTISTNGGTVAQVTQSGVDGFNYTPAANFSGTDTFTYTITNGFTTASADVTITVIPDVPPPIISGPTALSTNEDTDLTLGGFTITDEDSNSITVTLTANGTLSNTSFSGTPAEVTSTLNSVTYSPLENSTAADTISITASDGTLSDTHTTSITINPVDDTAEFGNLPASLQAFLNQTLNIPSFTVTDPDSTFDVTLSVDTGTIANGTATGGPGTVTVSGATYTPPSGFTGSATLTVTVDDGTTSPVTQEVPITVAPPVRPFAAGDMITIDEGDASGSVNVLTNDLAQSAVGNLVIDSTSLPIPTDQGTVTQSGTTFTYTPPNSDFFGSTSFTYTLIDSVDSGDGPSTGTVAITVNPINDAPVVSISTPQPLLEDSIDNPLGVSVTDIDNSTVTVTLSVGHGTLNAGGQSGSTIQIPNSSLGGLTYTPDGDYFGPETLNVDANDGTLSANDTVNITIQPVNDAPTLVVPGSQSFFTDFDNRFSSDPAPFSIADIDAGTNEVQVDLTIGDGTLTISSTSGVTVSQNPNGSNGIRISGSVSNINSALGSGVDYRTSQPGTKTLNVEVNDLGNTGSGNQLTASDTIDVEVLDFVPVDIIGQVFIDHDGDNHKDSNEPGIEGIDIILSGVDFQGNSVNMTDTTNALGTYEFLGLRPSEPGNPYTITQEQPLFIQNNHGGSNTMQLAIDQSGNVTPIGGTTNFGEGGFVPEFSDVFDHFIHLQNSPFDSGILFGSQNGTQGWSVLYGDGWDLTRYGNARLSINSDGESGVLTVFDSVLGQDRTANVSTKDATLTSRGKGTDKIYRVIGGSSLLGSSSSNAAAAANGEGESQSSHSIFLHAVDAIMAGA